MKLWMDDMRPAPNGYTRVYDVDGAICEIIRCKKETDFLWKQYIMGYMERELFEKCFKAFRNKALRCLFIENNRQTAVWGQIFNCYGQYRNGSIYFYISFRIFIRAVEEFKNAADYLNKKYNEEIVSCQFKLQYKNMRSIIEQDMRCVDKAMKAISACDLTPVAEPIRGGTDGSRLTYEGLNCPNLGTGGENYHGKFEYVSIQNMNTMVDILLNIITQ